MRVVITGGAGFLGSYLCEEFLNQGNQVICLDNLITGNKQNIKDLLNNKNFSFYEMDVSNYIDLKENNIDLVLHFASPASPVDYLNYPIQTLKVGALGTHNTLGLAKKYNSKYLLASTSQVYGDPTINPQPEDYYGNVNPIGERGVYDESKRFAEAIVMAYHKTHGLDTKIARIFNTYGPKMRINDGRVIPNFIVNALQNKPLVIYGDGTQTRSFCFVTDMIEGIKRLIDVDYHYPINLGNPEEITILELAELIIKLCQSSSTIRYEKKRQDDPQLRRPEIKKAKNLLGWQPKVPLEEGLKITINWFKLNFF
jgi:dTDP-glucose 4,6-dehydratase